MNFKFLFALVLSMTVFSGVAMAGKGGPLASGHWTGTGQAMYVDGTTAEIVFVSVDLTQEGNFLYGIAGFAVIIGDDPEPQEQFGQFSGHISGNAITGVMGGCFTEAPDCLGAAIFNGKLSGNAMTGTVVDFSDGSTSVLTLQRNGD